MTAVTVEIEPPLLLREFLIKSGVKYGACYISSFDQTYYVHYRSSDASTHVCALPFFLSNEEKIKVLMVHIKLAKSRNAPT
jgi:hypothetical protein